MGMIPFVARKPPSSTILKAIQLLSIIWIWAMKIINMIVFVDICRYLDLFRAAPASFSIQHKFIYICLSFSPFLSGTGLWCQMVLDHHSRIMLMMTPREEEDQKRLHFQNPPLWMVCLLAYIQVRLFWGEGAGTIWQVDKLDTDAVIKFYCTILSPYCSRQH